MHYRCIKLSAVFGVNKPSGLPVYTNNESCSVFQCDDNGLILLSQFCDEIVDCKDGSDEVSNKPGYKCNDCILPQYNLYDDLTQPWPPKQQGLSRCFEKDDDVIASSLSDEAFLLSSGWWLL